MITSYDHHWCTALTVADCKFYDEMNLMKIQYLIWKYLTTFFVPRFSKKNNLLFFTDIGINYHQM